MPPKLARSTTPAPEPTTAQALGSVIKSARDTMRKDKGLNGDLDRLPLLTWIMFLKFLDDLELQREEAASLAGKKFRPAIEPPYRWRDWAANPQGVTGDELLAFINQDECNRPDGKRGPGLFAYLRQLTSSNGDDRRDVVATVFKGVDNRMKSGYLLRDVINKVGEIHFTSSDELHTLGALYETMLRDMRDAAGDSGEFYTPRPVVRFMVQVTDPRLGETVLDPAAGTGGFLVETYNHLSQQVQTVAHRQLLQKGSLFGYEPKSLPYLLCQMNLLLHGLDAPHIDPGNALRFKLAETGERDRVNVILTNPPFGGEEERGVQGNFPEDRQTSETALLFLQLIMRRIMRDGTGRAAVVVPESVMSDSGVAQRVRQQLVQEFNLHTIVRLPKGVFEPYSDIQTNLLFFDTAKSKEGVWFYQIEVGGQRQAMRDPKYTLTSPISYDEFLPVIEWYQNKDSSDAAWFVPQSEIEDRKYSFDFRNPIKRQRSYVSIASLSNDIQIHVAKVSSKVLELQKQVARIDNLDPGSWPKYKLSRILDRIRIDSEPAADRLYKQITVKLYGKGVTERGVALGKDIKTRPQFLAHANDLIMSRIDARNGAFGIIPQSLDGAIVTQDFPMFRVDTGTVLAKYLALVLKSEEFVELCKRSSRGTTNRKRLNEEAFLSEELSLPDKEKQQQILDFYDVLSSITLASENAMAVGLNMERNICNTLVRQVF